MSVAAFWPQWQSRVAKTETMCPPTGKYLLLALCRVCRLCSSRIDVLWAEEFSKLRCEQFVASPISLTARTHPLHSLKAPCLDTQPWQAWQFRVAAWCKGATCCECLKAPRPGKRRPCSQQRAPSQPRGPARRSWPGFRTTVHRSCDRAPPSPFYEDCSLEGQRDLSNVGE